LYLFEISVPHIKKETIRKIICVEMNTIFQTTMSSKEAKPEASKKRKAVQQAQMDEYVKSTEDDNEYVSSVLATFEPDAPVELSAREAFEHVLTFGKHKGKTIAEVMKTQTGRIYLGYVRQKWTGLREQQKAAIDKALHLHSTS
jgi:hypothetical protein